MRRRELVGLLGTAIAGWPVAAHAEQRASVRRIALLMGVAETDPEGQARLRSFQRGLAEAGWVEGHNLHMELRWGAGKPEAFRVYASELVSQKPDAILANTPPALAALREQTSTIPTVFTGI